MRIKKTAINNNINIHEPTSRSKKLTPLYKPRSDNQKKYVSYLNDPKVPIVFGIGPAGCGKTLFACTTAIEGLKKGIFQKVILTRPIVPVEEEELGFLPGSLINKMDPWTRPLMDIFLEYYTQHELQFMLASGVIEISPLAYMRGRTFKRAFIIADEMQNSTPNQMLMLTTRIGDESKMVITGDLKQSDRCRENGLLDIMTKLKTYTKNNEQPETNEKKTLGIEMIEMNHGDIERSPIVSKILDIYEGGTKHPSNSTPKMSNKVEIAKQPPTLSSNELTPSSNNPSPDEPLFDLSTVSKTTYREIRYSVIGDAALIPSKDM